MTNLPQAIFALLAIFFFNDSVRRLANVPIVRWTYYAPLLSIPIMVVSFALIEDKAPTAADFFDTRMNQLATAVYSGTYMLALLFTVLRIIYMPRHKARGLYATFSAGLLVVAVAVSCHIAYVTSGADGGGVVRTALMMRVNADRSRVSPAWDLFNETFENGVYKSLIVLHNYERVNLMDFPESVQGRISQIEAKLDAQT